MGCFYCDEHHEGRETIMFKVGDMKAGTLYLFKDQAHKGRCALATTFNCASNTMPRLEVVPWSSASMYPMLCPCLQAACLRLQNDTHPFHTPICMLNARHSGF